MTYSCGSVELRVKIDAELSRSHWLAWVTWRPAALPLAGRPSPAIEPAGAGGEEGRAGLVDTLQHNTAPDNKEHITKLDHDPYWGRSHSSAFCPSTLYTLWKHCCIMYRVSHNIVSTLLFAITQRQNNNLMWQLWPQLSLLNLNQFFCVRKHTNQSKCPLVS